MSTRQLGPPARSVPASRTLRALLATLLTSLAGCPSTRLSEDPDTTPCEAGPCEATATDASPSSNSASRCAEGETCGPHQECVDTEDGIECVCEDPPEDCPDDDEPGTYCTPEGVEQHCVADDEGCIYIDDSQDVNCGSIDRTCFDNECRGSCAAGTYQCDAQGRSQRCGGDGEWGLPSTCGSGQICELIPSASEYGQCVDNPLLYFGRSSPTGGVEITLRIHDLYAQPVIPSTDVDLLAFGLFTTPNSVGGTVVFSLHADADGRPGALLAVGNQSRNLGLPGAQSMPAAITIRLTAGTRYWVTASFDEQTADDEDIRIYRFDDEPGPEGDYQSERIIYPAQEDLSNTTLDENTGAVSLYIVTDR